MYSIKKFDILSANTITNFLNLHNTLHFLYMLNLIILEAIGIIILFLIYFSVP